METEFSKLSHYPILRSFQLRSCRNQAFTLNYRVVSVMDYDEALFPLEIVGDYFLRLLPILT